MKQIIQFSAIIFLLANLGMLHATVKFEMANKSSQPIWIQCSADQNLFTGTASYDAEKKILPNESFSASISNGMVGIKISLVDPSSRDGQNNYREYHTMTSADNKNKILVWNHTKSPKEPLYPASNKYLMGLFKTKKSNNVNAKEIRLIDYNNL